MRPKTTLPPEEHITWSGMIEYHSEHINYILLNIMFHAPMRRFQLQLIYYITYFSTVVPSYIYLFLFCRPFVVNTTFSTGLVGVEVSSVQARRPHPQNLLKMLY
jgi:hypothetical protein